MNKPVDLNHGLVDMKHDAHIPDTNKTRRWKQRTNNRCKHRLSPNLYLHANTI